MNYGRIALLGCIVALASACESKVSRSSNQAVTDGGSGGSSGGSGSTGSGGSGAPPPPPKVYKTFAYVSGLSSLKSYSVDATSGTLSGITDIAAISTLSATVDPLGKYVWFIEFNVSNYKLYSYSIAQTTGVLALVGSISIPGQFSYRLAADPTGNYLFSSNNDTQNLTSYKVNRATGAVTVIGSLSASVSSATFTDIGVHPTGKYIYVAGSNVIGTYAVSATGSLSLLTTTAITGTTMSMINTGTALYIYAGNKVFAVDPVTGALSAGTNTTGVSLLAYANGFVYTAGASTVTGYSVGAGGVLTQVASATVNNPGSASALFKHLAASPDGKTLYVNSDSTGNGCYVHQFTINTTTGALTDKGVPVQISGNQLNSIWPIKIEQP